MTGPTHEHPSDPPSDTPYEYRLNHPELVVATYEQLVVTIRHLLVVIAYYEGINYWEDGDLLTEYDQSVLRDLKNKVRFFVALRDSMGVELHRVDTSESE